MNRVTFGIIFFIVSIIANLLFAALVLGLVTGLCWLFFHNNPQVFGQNLYMALPIGLVASFLIFSRIQMKIVKKYNLDRFGAKTEKKKPAVASGEERPAPRQTVLPDSVKEDEVDDKWRE